MIPRGLQVKVLELNPKDALGVLAIITILGGVLFKLSPCFSTRAALSPMTS
jgi:hypothetical protein